MPALGGSVIITSGVPCLVKKLSLHISITSPAKKDVLDKLFKTAFFLASSIASSTNSTPIIFFCLFAYKYADTAGTAV